MRNKTEISTVVRKRALGLTFVLSAASLAFAQEKLNINGKIVDKQNQPVPYASVTFSNKANKIFSDAALTDEKGSYQLNLVPGNYDVIIEAIDYKKSTVARDIRTGGSLGSFTIESESSATLTKTQDIQGVTITAASSKPYRVELDKKVYDPSTDVISKGGNLQDVLNNVPSVSVDADGTVNMRGSSNVKFLINGKPSSLLGIDDGANALQSIPAEQIERIEVITNPSSKFEASGTAGILNIILKKTARVGFNGSVTGALGYLPQTSLNTNLSWRRGDWIWFVNGGGGYREREGKNDTFTTNLLNGQATDFEASNSTSNSKSEFYNINTGFSRDLSEKTSVNLSVLARTFNNNNENTVENIAYDGNMNLLRAENTLSKGNSESTALQGDVGLDHKFNEQGHQISVSFSAQSNKSNGDENVDNSVLFDLPYNSTSFNKNRSTTYIGKIDYELPIGEASKIEAGYRLDANDNKYSFTNADDFNSAGVVAVLPDFSGDSRYDEKINALYGQFKSKTGKLGYQLGLRAEFTNLDIDFSNQAGKSFDKNKNYVDFFPSVFLSYDLGEKNNQLLVNYSRRINRPRSWFLTPFPNSISNRRNIFQGNPDLDPQYTDSFEVGYAFQKKSITINPTVYYRHTSGETQIVVKRDADDPRFFMSMPFNVGQAQRYGLDINGTADLFKWWKIMGSVDLYGYKVEGVFDDLTYVDEPIDYAGTGFSTRARLSNTFRIDKTFSVQLQGFYRGGEKTAASEREPMYMASLGLSKTVWNGNGTFTFNVQDLFNTGGFNRTQINPTFIRETTMKWNPRQVNLSFTYRFKQGDKVEQKRKPRNDRAEMGDDEMPPM